MSQKPNSRVFSVVLVGSVEPLIFSIFIHTGGIFGRAETLWVTGIFYFLVGGEMCLSRWLSWAFALQPALQPFPLSRFAPQSPQAGLW